MILADELFPIGQINKPHGISGEMSFSFTSDIFDQEEVPFFVFEMDGIFVPFFIADYRFKGSTTALISFDGISTEEQAKELMGKTIFIPKSYLDKVENDEIDVDYFAGFTINDKKGGVIGVISEIDKTTENYLFVIPTKDDELLIPAGDDYILDIDHSKKIIYVDLPDGLLDL